MRKRCWIAGVVIFICVIISFGMFVRSRRECAEYGVYLSETYEELPSDVSCKTLVIDAQYFSADEIAKLKQSNGTVISYLNVGSIEDFRSYYSKYQSLVLGPYENWEEEYWMDVSDEGWQEFIVDELAGALIDKGVDGFFIDNTDVYYHYKSQEIYDGLTKILKALKAKDMLVYINGGDAYVSKYLEENGNLDDILDGVNQESVFTSINWDTDTFSKNDEDTKQYYLEYLSAVAEDQKEVFLLEYTEDSKLAEEARAEAKKLGYKIYVSNRLEL
jgi:uncharacterized protein (TIGR01370 family)